VREKVVLRLEMVDKSISPLQTHCGPVFGDEAVQRGLLFLECGSIRALLRVPSAICPRHDTAPHQACVSLKRKSAARGMRAPRAPSIVDGFCPLPSPESVAGSVAPIVCPLVLVAAGVLSAASCEDARNDNTLATIPDGPEAVEPVGKWPRYVVQGLPRHGARSDSPAQ
jgi:hypothetical protein